MFRLYIDGSYSYPGNEPGYKWIERLRDRLKEAFNRKPEQTQKVLRSMAIEFFMNLISIEFPGLSRSTIQKTFVKNMTTKELDLMNHHLIDDLTKHYTEGK